ncbi:MAG: tRNA (adenosine(37)-N6)-threonylcarbamoyltransferase complex transferase subunit TsaD [bacterium]|nr:tRNA (adenosine(37)-N6)-threonylcarbamoyltransferase complex transferase subunit TsaD [bacterium]
MDKKLLVLGIETSCDETAVAVVRDGRHICSNVISSQVKIHAQYGGIVPEIASRKHIEVINQVVESAINDAKITLNDIEAIAVTYGPGLVGALLIGISFAKALAYGRELPLIPINHLEAHIYAVYLEHPQINLPAIALLVSGGHTEMVLVKALGVYEPLGRTKDDAVGEAYDKVAKWLGLGYPGGPIIDQLAKSGNKEAIRFPRAVMKRGKYDFSYSGLKTAVINYTRNAEHRLSSTDGLSLAGGLPLTEVPPLNDIVASFQEAAIDALTNKVMNAVKDTSAVSIIIGGGVAANSRLRDQLNEKTAGKGISLYIPSPVLCTDNAAMVAGLGFHKYNTGKMADLSLSVKPNLKWDE